MSTRLIPPLARSAPEPVAEGLWRRVCEDDSHLLERLAGAFRAGWLRQWVEEAILPQCGEAAQLAFAEGFVRGLGAGAEPWQAVWRGALAITKGHGTPDLGGESPIITFDRRDFEETLQDLLGMVGRLVEVRMETGSTETQARLKVSGELRGTLDVDSSGRDIASGPVVDDLRRRFAERPTFLLGNGASFWLPPEEFKYSLRDRELNSYCNRCVQSLMIFLGDQGNLVVEEAWWVEDERLLEPSIQRALDDGWH